MLTALSFPRAHSLSKVLLGLNRGLPNSASPWHWPPRAHALLPPLPAGTSSTTQRWDPRYLAARWEMLKSRPKDNSNYWCRGRAGESYWLGDKVFSYAGSFQFSWANQSRSSNWVVNWWFISTAVLMILFCVILLRQLWRCLRHRWTLVRYNFSTFHLLIGVNIFKKGIKWEPNCNNN